MVTAPRPLVVAVVAIAASCTSGTPSPSTPTAPAVERTQAVAPSSDWSVIRAGDLGRLVLGCVPGIERDGDTFALRSSGDGFASGITRLRPWIEARGDFGVSAKIGGDSENPADLELVGALGKPEFWRGLKRLDVGLRSGKLAVGIYTGEKATLSISQTFPTPGVTRPATVGIRKIGPDLIFRVAGTEVGRIADPGLFAGGVVHLGLNVGPRTTMTISDLAVEAPPSGAGAVTVVPGFLDTPASGTSLRSLAAARSFRIGAFIDAIGADPEVYGFLADPQSRRTLAREYNHLTVGVFASVISPTRDRDNFCELDALVAFARAHGMEMRAQTLIYGPPKWLTADTFTREQLLDWMRTHIQTVMGRYRGQIRSWEVANELFDHIPKDCSWNTKESQSALYVTALGQSWVDQAFRWAHEADPQAKLYYNENRAEGISVKSDCVYGLVKGMKDRGVPIDGVGMQSHLIIAEAKKETWNIPPPMESVAANMKRYADLGLSVQVTEIDVKVGKDAGPTELAAQARVYGDMLRTCLAAANCSAFTSWGVSDKYSWIRSSLQNQPWEKPLPFDDDFKPKPAYTAMLEALRR